MNKTVTFGEVMLRLATPGYERFGQGNMLSATYGGGEANVAVSLANYGLPVSFVTRVPDNDIAAAQTTITQCDTILADASSDRTATEQQIADLDIEIQVAEKNSTEAQADIDKAEGPNGTIAKAKEEHAAAVQKAKENAQDARVEAEKRAKDYYDEQKNIVHETDEHVKTTYQEYVKANGGDEDSIIQETKTVVVGTDANGNEQTKEVKVIKVADEKERNYNDLNATRDKINTNKK